MGNKSRTNFRVDDLLFAGWYLPPANPGENAELYRKPLGGDRQARLDAPARLDALARLDAPARLDALARLDAATDLQVDPSLDRERSSTIRWVSVK